MIPNGLEVTFMRLKTQYVKTNLVKFTNSFTLTVREALADFGVKNLDADEKVWIKRLGRSDFRADPYKLTAQLNWVEHHRCIIVLAKSHQDAQIALKSLSSATALPVPTPTPSPTLPAPSTPAPDPPDKKKHRGPPKSTQIRKMLLKKVVRKKIKERLKKEEENQKSTNQPDDKKDPD